MPKDNKKEYHKRTSESQIQIPVRICQREKSAKAIRRIEKFQRH